LFSTKLDVAKTADGRVMVYSNGKTAYGYPMRKCRNCSWKGDFTIAPQPPEPMPKSTYTLPPQSIMDDDDEDYINHYYH